MIDFSKGVTKAEEKVVDVVKHRGLYLAELGDSHILVEKHDGVYHYLELLEESCMSDEWGLLRPGTLIKLHMRLEIAPMNMTNSYQEPIQSQL